MGPVKLSEQGLSLLKKRDWNLDRESLEKIGKFREYVHFNEIASPEPGMEARMPPVKQTANLSDKGWGEVQHKRTRDARWNVST